MLDDPADYEPYDQLFTNATALAVNDILKPLSFEINSKYTFSSLVYC